MLSAPGALFFFEDLMTLKTSLAVVKEMGSEFRFFTLSVHKSLNPIDD